MILLYSILSLHNIHNRKDKAAPLWVPSRKMIPDAAKKYTEPPTP